MSVLVIVGLLGGVACVSVAIATLMALSNGLKVGGETEGVLPQSTGVRPYELSEDDKGLVVTLSRSEVAQQGETSLAETPAEASGPSGKKASKHSAKAAARGAQVPTEETSENEAAATANAPSRNAPSQEARTPDAPSRDARANEAVKARSEETGQANPSQAAPDPLAKTTAPDPDKAAGPAASADRVDPVEQEDKPEPSGEATPEQDFDSAEIAEPKHQRLVPFDPLTQSVDIAIDRRRVPQDADAAEVLALVEITVSQGQTEITFDDCACATLGTDARTWIGVEWQGRLLDEAISVRGFAKSHEVRLSCRLLLR